MSWEESALASSLAAASSGSGRVACSLLRSAKSLADTLHIGAVGDASAEMDPEYASALARIQQHLSSEDSKAAVCLVCLESMEADAPVWHCNKSCHCVFHLLCIQVFIIAPGSIQYSCLCSYAAAMVAAALSAVLLHWTLETPLAAS